MFMFIQTVMYILKQRPILSKHTGFLNSKISDWPIKMAFSEYWSLKHKAYIQQMVYNVQFCRLIRSNISLEIKIWWILHWPRLNLKSEKSIARLYFYQIYILLYYSYIARVCTFLLTPCTQEIWSIYADMYISVAMM